MSKLVLRIAELSAISVAVLSLSVTKAHAYVDAGTGSYVLQILAAGFLASLFFLRCFWRNLKESIAKHFGRRDDK